ncbi:MAG: sulfotransferase [Proteobacteria bacterium]|nr:sulfotransferase [Pseudomonadota bacterium]
MSATPEARTTSRDYRRPYRPWPLAAANRVGRALGRVGLQTSFRESSLVAAARRSTGLHFFDDDLFREPLRRLADALEREADLHPLGRLIARQGLLRVYRSRLLRAALVDLHPEIEATPVEAPVFIVGLQRTGTTVLHRLLSLEPALRPLISWEALSPAPDPAAPVETRAGARDSRMRLAELAEKSLRYIAPDFFAIHPVEAHSPEEDVLLLDLCGFGTTAEASQHVPSFSRWLESMDHRPAYRDFRSWIQLLLWQRPGRWLGKTPHHLEHLDALLDVFPDARIIQTHRDPLRVVPSFCSMICHARGVFSDRVDPHEVGRHWGNKQIRMVERAMALRDGDGARGESFIDVHYRDLVTDPLKQVRQIYDFLGLALSSETEAQMQGWIDANPRNRLGHHRYRVEDFGLVPGEIDERLAGYRARFDIPHE